MIIGVIVGIAGGVGLGLAFMNKKRAFSLALIGALGFSIAFVIVLAADIGGMADFAANLFQPSGGSIKLFILSLRLWRGLVAGSVVGAIGGSALGYTLALYNKIQGITGRRQN